MTTLDAYQEAALRTARGADGTLPTREYLALGLCSESGEVAGLIKKFGRHGKPFSADDVADELGDVIWYAATLATVCGLSLSDVADRNIAKLRARYRDGFKPAGGGADADRAAAAARALADHSADAGEMVDPADHAVGAAMVEPAPPQPAGRVIGSTWECRSCGVFINVKWVNGVWVPDENEHPGWRYIDRIDGPNTMCDECANGRSGDDWIATVRSSGEWPNARIGDEIWPAPLHPAGEHPVPPAPRPMDDGVRCGEWDGNILRYTHTGRFTQPIAAAAYDNGTWWAWDIDKPLGGTPNGDNDIVSPPILEAARAAAEAWILTQHSHAFDDRRKP